MPSVVNGEKPLLENRYFMIQGNKAFFLLSPKYETVKQHTYLYVFVFQKEVDKKKNEGHVRYRLKQFSFSLIKAFSYFLLNRSIKASFVITVMVYHPHSFQYDV